MASQTPISSVQYRQIRALYDYETIAVYQSLFLQYSTTCSRCPEIQSLATPQTYSHDLDQTQLGMDDVNLS